ncbi:polyamine aminopropyltransferase [Vallitalea okinawensis]|uniref:polyamine aminopropyltransferase n=1 Tax=Vallitalea okinawensis TaxID=2078660 RepID=UPI000CFC4FD8|nr:polyamine aminopropyltransferase [Vallitalea okinawensis]
MELWYAEQHTDTVEFRIKVKEQICHQESPFQKIDFFKSEEFGTFFTLDGLMMVNEKDEFVYHDMISHIPLAVNPYIKNVLVIGGGDGGTVRELTRYKTIEKIDMVEIDEMVVRACQKYLPLTSSQLTDERVNLYFEDGIKFLEGIENKYDLILVDSTDPIGPGEGLFSVSFYTNCYKALTDNGILINQHESPYYERDAREMKRAHKKIKDLFPISKVYQFHMPTYPSGHWLFGFASKALDPIEDVKFDEWRKFALKTKYYNEDLHIGCFALPTFVKEMLEDVSE